MQPVEKRDWSFLRKYDLIVKGVYLKIVDYKDKQRFTPLRLANDENFIKTLNRENELYKEWIKDHGNPGHYSMWLYYDRWERIFKRMHKLGLICCNSGESSKPISDRNFIANTNPDVIKSCKKNVFAKYL